MTPLRAKMIEDLRLRGLASTTERTYVAIVAQFARRFGRSPAELDYGHVRGFLLDLRERGRSPATLAQYWSALRFLYTVTLGRDDFTEHVPRPRQPRHIGRVGPSLAELRLIFAHAATPFDRAFFQTCYGAGLRISEALALRVADIDTENRLLHVRRGKGGHARAVHLAPDLLSALRTYWRELRPPGPWLFPARRNGGAHDHRDWADRPPCPTGMQRRFRAAVRAAGIPRRVTLHDLRRSYATHLLEHGIDLRKLQVALGHAEPGTTALYAHVSHEQLRSIPSPLSFL